MAPPPGKTRCTRRAYVFFRVLVEFLRQEFVCGEFEAIACTALGDPLGTLVYIEGHEIHLALRKDSMKRLRDNGMCVCDAAQSPAGLIHIELRQALAPFGVDAKATYVEGKRQIRPEMYHSCPIQQTIGCISFNTQLNGAIADYVAKERRDFSFLDIEYHTMPTDTQPSLITAAGFTPFVISFI